MSCREGREEQDGWKKMPAKDQPFPLKNSTEKPIARADNTFFSEIYNMKKYGNPLF